MNRKQAALAAAAVIIPAMAVFGVQSRTPDVDAPSAGAPEIIAASFVSAWCASCKILEPRLAKVIPEFRGAPVKFEALDFTFGPRPELAQQAADDGYSLVYARFAGATGFTLLIDPDTGDVVDRLTMSDTETSMRERIAAAIARAQAAEKTPR
ncbi:MAG: hypothetical protein K2Q06_07140 [Parvularculaceae bacterium]|nr:hypothetical protein [Parvularculaceae bacterium]